MNNQYRDLFKEKGLVVSGVNTERDLVEIVELPTSVHPWFVGVQFHPEFQSRPLRPHPLFKDFIGACVKKK
ncbi:MAG: CTP synthase [Candidatus Magasanikbacteria bacterium GW2011_GWC2_45_8]|uniref:CTP synthase (glutamine hydrolyzing) n=1 Tax=Candidatus Magasanikbacteria bacterium GW2011_GWC2_45_8 TaxID=1619050 RepID=A0A0G1Q5D1_9BACT|nr:MAG: CTP synthase [Candidatus Magasanikbacteria bacterium GW2011_GWC2_45_8]